MAEIEVQLSPLTFPEPPPLVITEESFLIGRESQMFRVWKDARLKRLSREHARLDIDGSVASLCDLGSTNGTKINNKPLTPLESYPIRDGDVISFANVFKYEVKIVQCKPTEDTVVTRVGKDENPTERIVKNKTMFIASADSYLEMLCEEDDRNETESSPNASGRSSRRWILIAIFLIIGCVAGTAFYLTYF